MMDLIYIIGILILSLIYFWILYNTPILAMGIKRMRRNDLRKEKKRESLDCLPAVSIVVPVKDEEKVVGRLLRALLRLEYQQDKMEIVIVEDASTDKTPEICKWFAEQHPDRVKFFHRPFSKGKPSALNFGFKHATGEIVAVFDADNVPKPDTLLRAVKYFEDPSVAAVQGTTLIINADENMLTKFISYEEAVWLNNYLQGKDALNLFVPLTGSCQFLRREIVEKVGNWDENCLAEDLEMSAKITDKGFKIRYAPDVISWQEASSNLSKLITQRIRWFRGYMEVAIMYGRFLKRMEKRSIDAEVTLIGPYMMTLFLTNYLTSMLISIFPVQPDSIFLAMSKITLILTTITLLIAGIALMYVTKPVRVKNLLWLPFIYAYWSLQCILTTYALLQVVLRRPKRWLKTPKTGRCTVKNFEALDNIKQSKTRG